MAKKEITKEIEGLVSLEKLNPKSDKMTTVLEISLDTRPNPFVNVVMLPKAESGDRITKVHIQLTSEKNTHEELANMLIESGNKLKELLKG